MEKDLEGRVFLRVHRSYIVNCRNIASFTAAGIGIGSQDIPIGESYRDQVMKVLNHPG